jgi:broad specificity phosphatase PhoE
VQVRMLAALRRIARRHTGVVAVVSHAEPIRYALLHAAGRTLDEWQDVTVEPASVHEFVELTG